MLTRADTGMSSPSTLEQNSNTSSRKNLKECSHYRNPREHYACNVREDVVGGQITLSSGVDAKPPRIDTKPAVSVAGKRIDGRPMTADGGEVDVLPREPNLT